MFQREAKINQKKKSSHEKGGKWYRRQQCKTAERASPCPHLSTAALAESSLRAVTQMGATSFATLWTSGTPLTECQQQPCVLNLTLLPRVRPGSKIICYTSLYPRVSILDVLVYGMAVAVVRGVCTMPCWVPPSAGLSEASWVGCWVSPPVQHQAQLTRDIFVISSSTAQVGTGKLEWSLQSLQGVFNKGLSQS